MPPEEPMYYPTTTECTPTGLRYKPVWTYKLPYAPDTFACCDHMANNHGNKIAFAFTDRDYGVIELGRLHPNVDFHGDKRFYIDFKMWKDPDGGPIKAADMAFGYDYQRLYTLYKQSLNDGTYKLWLTRYETGNYKDGSLITPPISIPLYTFIHSRRLRGHPALPAPTYPHDYRHVEEEVPQDGWDDLWKYRLDVTQRPAEPSSVLDLSALVPNLYPASVRDSSQPVTGFSPTARYTPVSLAVITAGHTNVEFWGSGYGHSVTFDVLTTDGKHLFGGGTAVDAYGNAQVVNSSVVTTANGFNPDAVYDASQLNGTGSLAPYDYTNLASFSIDGMNIQFCGGDDGRANRPRYFSIDNVTTDLVIMAMGCSACGFNIRGAWVAPPPPPPPPPGPKEEDIFCSVLEYLEAYGVAGICLDRPALEPFFNCFVSHDKVFVTMPVFFKPDNVKLSWLTDPEKLKVYWTPDHPRVVYQLLIMLDETTSQIEACAVVGAFSWWVEEKNTPWPDITPQMPLKARMTQIDDCVVWQCVHERTFPASMTGETFYEHIVRAYKTDEGNITLPITDYDPNAWEASKLLERFWQPYQTEYVRIPDLIEDLLEMHTTVLRPLQYRVTQAYIWTPIVTDLYKKALVDWSGRRVYGLRGKEFIEYEVVYHNYKRKIIRGLKIVDTVASFDNPVEFTFEPGTEGEPLTLNPGTYTIVAEGASGGDAHYTSTHVEDDQEPVVTSGSHRGGLGARVVGEFELSTAENFFVYVGKAGSPNGDSVGAGSGKGGTYKYKETDVDLHGVPLIDTALTNIYPENPLAQEITAANPSGVRGQGVIPAGYKNVKILIDGYYGAADSINVFTQSGKHLVGTPVPAPRWAAADTSVIDVATLTTEVLTDTNGFNDGATYDGSELNGTGTYVPLEAFSLTAPSTFSLLGMNFKYSGDYGMGSVSIAQSAPFSQQYLEIDEVTETLVLLVVGAGVFGISAAWEKPAPDQDATTNEWESHAGSGGSLTALVYRADVPTSEVLVAGSGGGAGISKVDDERTGGDGGEMTGAPGVSDGVTVAQGGSLDEGGTLRYGQDAQARSTAGGGGAGYSGGRANQATAPRVMDAGGGGGGSSFINGVGSYAQNVSAVAFTSGVVTPAVVEGDGSLKITGVEHHDSVPAKRAEFTYEDHHLGEFQYLCAGHFVVSKRESTTPPSLPPVPAMPKKIAFIPVPKCAPMPPIPIPVPEPIYVPPEEPEPVVQLLDLVFILDVTGSMTRNLQIMGEAIASLTARMAAVGFNDVNYFALYYTDYQYWPYAPATDTVDGPGPYVMKTQSVIKQAMQKPYQLWPGGNGGYEPGQTAILRASSVFGPELRHAGASSPTPYIDTFYIVITDEPNYEGNADTDAAISMAQSSNASIMWIISKGQPPTPQMSDSATGTSGRVMQIMDSSAGWGAEAADQLTAAIQEAVPITPPIDLAPIQKTQDWAKIIPKMEDLTLPALALPPTAPPPPAPEGSAPTTVLIPEYTGWHTFAIENLACNTWMVDVTINSENASLKIGPPSRYSASAIDPIPQPDLTEMHWDEIPPAHEVRFSVYADTFEGTALEGLKLSYALEIR